MEVPRREADCREAAVGAERVHDFPNVRCNGGRADGGVAIRPGKWGRLPLKQPPRRQEEAVPVHNDGLDNANSDLILYVNLELINKKLDRRYVVQEMLGQGTFGQVVKCWDTETNNFVAVKVIKNQPAFYQQAIVEVSLLSLLNVKFDPDDQHHIVRMLDFFLCQNHLCITFEMLGNNLYELLKRNSLRGLKMKFVRSFSRQILDTLIILKEAGIIHCDLKPENILITPTVTTAAGVKVIDFGSACMVGKTIYSYIQSRYYRSPEVLIGYPYTTAIDMWSLGCIAAELYIGFPLFPGASEYDMISRMIEILGSSYHPGSQRSLGGRATDGRR